MWREKKGRNRLQCCRPRFVSLPIPALGAPLFALFGHFGAADSGFKNSPIFAFLRNRASSFDSGYFKVFGLMAAGLDVFRRTFQMIIYPPGYIIPRSDALYNVRWFIKLFLSRIILGFDFSLFCSAASPPLR